MPAVQHPSGTVQPERGTVRLNVELFDKKMADLGHKSVAAQARAIHMDRGHLHKIRNGEYAPNVRKAAEMAALCGVTVDELFPRVSADT